MRVAAAVVFISCVVAVGAWAGNEILPPGFQVTVVATPGQIQGAVAVEFAPDGDIFVAAYKGNIYLIRGGSPTLMQSIYGGVYPGTNEEGLHNFVLDPDYATNKHVWIYHSYFDGPGPSVDRLTRFTNVNDQFVDPLVIFQGPLSNLPLHAGGCLAFTSKGTILLGFGDDGNAGEAQLPTDLKGSILHMDRQGNPVPGNPYYDGVSGDPRVWATGMRNPYRCALQPETENLFVGDVGGGTWEEIDIVFNGGNMGWPLSEGPSSPSVPNITYPIYSYNHNGMAAAVIGGDFSSASFHPDYQGDYFFADHQRKTIYRMVMETDTRPAHVEPWGILEGRPCEIDFGPDGAMYVTAHGSFGFGLGRIDFVGGANNQPVGVGVADQDSGLAPLAVAFEAGGSSDPDEDLLTYLWDFGDGDTSTARAPDHTYAAGVHTAVVTVDDGNGLSDTAPPIRIVAGNRKPDATVTAPSGGSNFDGGQVINFSGDALDAEEGTIPCSDYTWDVTFNYDDHAIAVQGPTQGTCSGSFVTLTTGNPSVNSWYEVRLTAADTGAPLGSDAVLENANAVTILPNTSEITLQTLPLTDLDVAIDGSPLTAPAVVGSVVSFVRTLDAPANPRPDGHTYSWLSWSDGGAKEHDYVTPPTNSSLTATFGCDVIVETQGLQVARAAGQQLAMSWDAVSDSCLASGPARYRVYGAAEAAPATFPGEFPTDPSWTLLGSSSSPAAHVTPNAGDRYFLVVAVGTDTLDGVVGHYP